MASQTHHQSDNVIAFVPRPAARATAKRDVPVVLPFDARRMARMVAPVVDIDCWYHQEAVEGSSKH